jgi:hypothetical protein
MRAATRPACPHPPTVTSIINATAPSAPRSRPHWTWAGRGAFFMARFLFLLMTATVRSYLHERQRHRRRPVGDTTEQRLTSALLRRWWQHHLFLPKRQREMNGAPHEQQRASTRSTSPTDAAGRPRNVRLGRRATCSA